MQDQKLGLLDKMLGEEAGTFLVFSRTKHGADRIGRKLEKLGYTASIIHGDRSQSQRTSALKAFAHRIGRTGRAGKEGFATTFVMPQERSDARRIERELKISFLWREADKNLA